MPLFYLSIDIILSIYPLFYPWLLLKTNWIVEYFHQDLLPLYFKSTTKKINTIYFDNSKDLGNFLINEVLLFKKEHVYLS